jgi:hypothetical protein
VRSVMYLSMEDARGSVSETPSSFPTRPSFRGNEGSGSGAVSSAGSTFASAATSDGRGGAESELDDADEAASLAGVGSRLACVRGCTRPSRGLSPRFQAPTRLTRSRGGVGLHSFYYACARALRGTRQAQSEAAAPPPRGPTR